MPEIVRKPVVEQKSLRDNGTKSNIRLNSLFSISYAVPKLSHFVPRRDKQRIWDVFGRNMDYPITPAVWYLREKKVDFTPPLFHYVEKGGERESAKQLSLG